jgi:hypothetical protein
VFRVNQYWPLCCERKPPKHYPWAPGLQNYFPPWRLAYVWLPRFQLHVGMIASTAQSGLSDPGNGSTGTIAEPVFDRPNLDPSTLPHWEI